MLVPPSQRDSTLALLNQPLQRLRQDQAIGGHNPSVQHRIKGLKLSRVLMGLRSVHFSFWNGAGHRVISETDLVNPTWESSGPPFTKSCPSLRKDEIT